VPGEGDLFAFGVGPVGCDVGEFWGGEDFGDDLELVGEEGGMVSWGMGWKGARTYFEIHVIHLG